MVDWQSEEQLPSATGQWECWRPPYGRRHTGEFAVRTAIRRWHPWDPLLVGTPNSTKLLPPVCIEALSQEVQSRMLLQYRLFLGLILAWSCAAGIAAVVLSARVFANAAVAGLLLFALVLLQYLLVFQSLDVLRDFSRFVAWVYVNPSRDARTALVVMLLIGATQYWFQSRSDGLESLVMQAGLVFDLARAEPWRYLSGPFIHSGLIHWISNTALLVIALGLGGAFGKRTALAAVFLAGTVFPSVLLAFLPHSVRSDALVGISGGVLAILGWIIGAGVRKRTWFPPHFAALIGSFTFVIAAMSSLLSESTNDVVHAAGILTGLVAGMISFGWKLR